jgi:hypothetical protein
MLKQKAMCRMWGDTKSMTENKPAGHGVGSRLQTCAGNGVCSLRAFARVFFSLLVSTKDGAFLFLLLLV